MNGRVTFSATFKHTAHADRFIEYSTRGFASRPRLRRSSDPGARKLYIYLKGEHLPAKPAIKDFVAAYAKQWGAGGPLEKRGLVPFGGADGV